MANVPEVDTRKLRIPRPEETSVRRPHRRRRFPWGILAVLVLFGIPAWLFWPRIATYVSAVRALEVKTGYAIRTSPRERVEETTASGYVVARTRAALAAQTAGRLIELRVDVGSRVRAGDLIARIDPDTWEWGQKEMEAALEQQRAEVLAAEVRVAIAKKGVARIDRAITEGGASLREAEADLAEAQRVLELEEKLAETGSGIIDNLKKARNDVARLTAVRERKKAGLDTLAAERDSAEAEVRGAEARVTVAKKTVEEAEARFAAAKKNLANTEIRAPFDGVILRKEADVGEMVVPALAGGSTSRGAVVTMADFSSLEMEVDVFERDISRIREGSPADIELNAWAGVVFKGHVRQVVPTAERSKGTVQVKVAFDAPDPRIFPEMGGKVVFLRERPAEDLAPEVTVPASAVVTRDGRTGVFLLERDRVRFQEITPGERREERLVAASGLSGGEEVVLDPPPGLGEGSLVSKPEE